MKSVPRGYAGVGVGLNAVNRDGVGNVKFAYDIVSAARTHCVNNQGVAVSLAPLVVQLKCGCRVIMAHACKMRWKRNGNVALIKTQASFHVRRFVIEISNSKLFQKFSRISMVFS